MKATTKNKRRDFLKKTLGSAGALATAHALGSVCREGTAEQPLGPFFPNEKTPAIPTQEIKDPNVPPFLANDNDLTFLRGQEGKAQGQKVKITGQVFDKNCQPLENATIIIWQASHNGRYNHQRDSANQSFKDPRNGTIIHRELDPHFQYWGKDTSGKDGQYEFTTIVPGFYPADLNRGWYRPPHIHFLITSTGNPQFITQMYFRGEALKDNEWIQELNQKDFLLQHPDLKQKEKDQLTVNFTPSKDADNLLAGTFDIYLKE